MFYSVPL